MTINGMLIKNGNRIEENGSYVSIDATTKQGTWRDQDLWWGGDNRDKEGSNNSFFSTKSG